VDLNKLWDWFISEIQDYYDIDENEKKKILKNLSYFREFFGVRWFDDENNLNHPLGRYMSNFGPENITFFSNIGHGLFHFKDKENFDEILKRMKQIKFWDVYHEFRVGLSLFEKCVSFDFLKKTPEYKTPDIRFISENKQLFMEITKKQIPKKQQNDLDNVEKITRLLFPSKDFIKHDLASYWNIHCPLSSSRTNKTAS